MRHGKKFNHLGRKAAHRKAMLSNMACSLIEHKRIKTTLAKAKSLRVYIEPLITKSKNDTTHSRRIVFSYLKQKNAVTELFGDISNKIANRPGGYTRIIKLGNRLGDNAQMAYIELVDYNELYFTDKPKKKKTRRRGGAKSASKTPVLGASENVEVVNEKSSKDIDEGIETTVEKVEEEKVDDIIEEKIETESVEQSQEEKKEEGTEEKIEDESTEDESTEDSQKKQKKSEEKEDSNDSSEEEKAD